MESPEHSALLYDEEITIEQYYKLHREMMHDKGYIGKSPTELIRATRSLMGKTEFYYRKAPSYPNWDKIKDKYAANVPHLMIFPLTGIVQYESVSTVTVL